MSIMQCFHYFFDYETIYYVNIICKCMKLMVNTAERDEVVRKVSLQVFVINTHNDEFIIY